MKEDHPYHVIVLVLTGEGVGYQLWGTLCLVKILDESLFSLFHDIACNKLFIILKLYSGIVKLSVGEPVGD